MISVALNKILQNTGFITCKVAEIVGQRNRWHDKLLIQSLHKIISSSYLVNEREFFSYLSIFHLSKHHAKWHLH